ncbi:FtsK/SpoIIIE domain-containing protein [Knoellia sp. LjRoot47]|uniref:FtsK/SpoIIIE domain-containing protein n=1 Tax=Knoellia sp. LjRoot47 TaxID=3342330 RepID=UPI003ECEFD71
MGNSTVLDLTVLLPSRRHAGVDVRVTAPPGTTFKDVRPVLGEVVGARSAHVSCQGRIVGDEAVVGVPPLVHGATLVLGEPVRSAGPAAGPIDLVVVAGPDAGRRCPVPPEGVVVGRSAGLGLSLDDERLSRRHVRIAPDDSGFRVTDLSSTNGTRCGTTLLAGDSCVVAGGELVAIGSSLLRLQRSGDTVTPTHAPGDGRVTVNRAPRPLPPQLTVTVVAPTPPTPPRRTRVPWLAAALPLPFAALLALVFGVQMLAFALLSPLMLVGNVLADRVGGRREHAREVAAHEAELAVRREELDAVRTLERDQRWRALPDAATLLAIATGPGPRLWERRRAAPDFGRVRVGVGELPSRSGWAPAGGGAGEHPLLADLPVEVDLTSVGGLGVAGPRADVAGVVCHVLGQLVTLHSPRDLRVVVDSEDAADTLSWARWLPHTTAYADLPTCLDVLREVVTSREDERERGTPSPHPFVVVVLTECDSATAGELLDLLDRGRGLGVVCLVGAASASSLPGSCHAVVGLGQGVGDGTARLDVDGREPVPAFTVDLVGWWWGERMGRALAPLVDATTGGEVVPHSVDLLDLVTWLGPAAADDASCLTSVVEHWRTGDGRPVARLGSLAGQPWTVDLTTDGPHVLVGGTTGSGKSELLRTLVASLALECSPRDVSFVLVDYKGGSAFGECADLPHTVGLVTNLDDGLARRALVSLGAEVDRRESLLAASGARDFEDHRRRGGSLPRLVIVIDEFRMLAEELPDFVDGMVALAAVGRSLGLHLVLATQRPAGAVTTDIAANVNLRIAMRVRDVADSTDVIGAPDAARVSPDRPGRGFARGGDGDLVEFQAARVGGPATSTELRVDVLDPAGRVSTSTGALRAVRPSAPGGDAPEGLAALASLLRGAALTGAVGVPHRPWLEPLAEELGVAEVGVGGVGLIDLPAAQRQVVLAHEGDGHWLVAGGPRSGRTTAARSIVAAHVAPPGSATHVHVIDTSGQLADLEALPHVGTVVDAGDVSRVRRLLQRLRADVDAVGQPTHPVLLVVDGWERLDTEGDLSLGGLRDDVLALLQAGDTSLRAVVTGDRSVLSSRLGSVAAETFVLPLADPSDATYAGLSRRDLPSSTAPGRAVRLRDRAEVQLARRDPLAEAAPRDPAAPLPLEVPRLPSRVDIVDVLAASGAQLSGERFALGLSAESGSTAFLEPARHGRRVLFAGHPGSGRSTALAVVGASAVLAGRTVAVVEGPDGPVARSLRRAVADVTDRWAPGEVVRVGEAFRVDPWGADVLVDAKRRCPDLVVLVDDADRLDSTPVEAAVVELTAVAERDRGLVVAASTVAAATAQFRGLVPAVARAQAGLLLSPRVPGDGEGFGVRVPRGVLPVPGRALLISGRVCEEVQVATVRDAAHRGSRGPGPSERLRPTVRCV